MRAAAGGLGLRALLDLPDHGPERGEASGPGRPRHRAGRGRTDVAGWSPGGGDLGVGVVADADAAACEPPGSRPHAPGLAVVVVGAMVMTPAQRRPRRPGRRRRRRRCGDLAKVARGGAAGRGGGGLRGGRGGRGLRRPCASRGRDVAGSRRFGGGSEGPGGAARGGEGGPREGTARRRPGRRGRRREGGGAYRGGVARWRCGGRRRGEGSGSKEGEEDARGADAADVEALRRTLPEDVEAIDAATALTRRAEDALRREPEDPGDVRKGGRSLVRNGPERLRGDRAGGRAPRRASGRRPPRGRERCGAAGGAGREPAATTAGVEAADEARRVAEETGSPFAEAAAVGPPGDDTLFLARIGFRALWWWGGTAVRSLPVRRPPGRVVQEQADTAAMEDSAPGATAARRARRRRIALSERSDAASAPRARRAGMLRASRGCRPLTGRRGETR